jgi:predicted PurR-regulated permease PerM
LEALLSGGRVGQCRDSRALQLGGRPRKKGARALAVKPPARTRLTSTAQVLTGTAAGVALLYFLRDILIPFVIAFVLVVLVEALVTWMRRLWPKAPQWLVAGGSGVIVIVAAAAGIFALAQGGVQLVQQAPALLDRIEQIVQSIGRSLHLRQTLHLDSLLGKVNVAQVAGYVLSGVQGVGGTVLLVIIYFGFMLAGRQRIGRKFDAMAAASQGDNLTQAVVERAAADIRTYMWVQTVTGLMITAGATAVMLIVGFDNVLFWTVVFFLLTFIPQIGVTVGSVAPALFALIQFPTTWQAIAIFAVIQVVAFVVGNLIYPRMQAGTQNIDPIATILALSFWTVLWGIPGAFLAVPMTLMLMMIFAQFENTKWVAAALSNDGKPDFRKSP